MKEEGLLCRYKNLGGEDEQLKTVKGSSKTEPNIKACVPAKMCHLCKLSTIHWAPIRLFWSCRYAGLQFILLRKILYKH